MTDADPDYPAVSPIDDADTDPSHRHQNATDSEHFLHDPSYTFACGVPACQCWLDYAGTNVTLSADCRRTETTVLPYFNAKELRRLSKVILTGTPFCRRFGYHNMKKIMCRDDGWTTPPVRMIIPTPPISDDGWTSPPLRMVIPTPPINDASRTTPPDRTVIPTPLIMHDSDRTPTDYDMLTRGASGDDDDPLTVIRTRGEHEVESRATRSTSERSSPHPVPEPVRAVVLSVAEEAIIGTFSIVVMIIIGLLITWLVKVSYCYTMLREKKLR